ncbi:Hpt domain-containing protein [Collimonas sp. OK412]|uniref:Hpt domain-containing protein n=1 Tax=Collimonas sp. (strain OK412) TaxID=1801619 RepID=UPI0008EB8042|nr:Hpt domain-containing protein [Collimonas sp. OK412]SFB75889.1 Hpt domain-containing protein [Collimonas sp. OK412]
MQSYICHHFSPEMFLKHSYNDKGVFVDLCKLFLQVGNEQFARLKSAVQAGNVGSTTQECHALKGTLLISGADAAVRMLDQIEIEFNRKKQVCAAEKILELQNEITLTMDEVRDFLLELESLELQH